jgi:hypothetical protein
MTALGIKYILPSVASEKTTVTAFGVPPESMHTQGIFKSVVGRKPEGMVPIDVVAPAGMSLRNVHR